MEEIQIICFAVSGFQFNNCMLVPVEIAFCSPTNFSNSLSRFVKLNKEDFYPFSRKAISAFEWQKRNQLQVDLRESEKLEFTTGSVQIGLLHCAETGCKILTDSDVSARYVKSIAPSAIVYVLSKEDQKRKENIGDYCGLKTHKNNPHCAFNRAVSLAWFLAFCGK